MKSSPAQRNHITDLMMRRGFSDDGGVILRAAARPIGEATALAPPVGKSVDGWAAKLDMFAASALIDYLRGEDAF